MYAIHKLGSSHQRQDALASGDTEAGTTEGVDNSSFEAAIDEVWREVADRADRFGIDLPNASTAEARFEALINQIWPELVSQGDARSALQLALFYENFLERDDLAFKYRVLASQLGDPRALVTVGVAYELGKGVDKSTSKAQAYYSIATELGVEPAREFLADLEERNKLSGMSLLTRALKSRIERFLPYNID